MVNKKLPKYPIYIISKGRWQSNARLTSNALEKIQVPYKIVVEPQEFQQYAEGIDPKKILVLPFSNLGLGGIPARNWVWEHSILEGHKRHWILDDNLPYFQRHYKGERIDCKTGHPFFCIEEFVDRYENIVMAGMQYVGFADKMYTPVIFNTRIYSCILLDNSLDIRWCGRYIEDTDLSLRVLKRGFCTALFYAFICKKIKTMTMKGGNTESLYKLQEADGRYLMAKSLWLQHPDIVKIGKRWGRWQHLVNYKPFKKNVLKLKPEFQNLKEEVNNFGMVLTKPLEKVLLKKRKEIKNAEKSKRKF